MRLIDIDKIQDGAIIMQNVQGEWESYFGGGTGSKIRTMEKTEIEQALKEEK